MEQFAKHGDFCPNQACPDYQKLQTIQASRTSSKQAKLGKECNGSSATPAAARHLPAAVDWASHWLYSAATTSEVAPGEVYTDE